MSHRNEPNAPQNRLGAQTSPYLLQHATNPVDWYPWGPEAFARAQAEDKPVLLSIGYSACHWCHVMAHESFEDEATAQVMNELFVNVKVDREERPDLDKLYQLAHQMLTQRGGGWPLTMFLAPQDQRPFFGGTYFPKTPRFDMPAFTDLLARVSEFYRSRREDIAQQSAALDEAFRHMRPAAADAATELTSAPIDLARDQLASTFDAEQGGFGSAPKFPHAPNLELLLRKWRASASTAAPDLHSLYMVSLTLNRMAEGGIHDHLSGGFARYSVDRYWMIPHFEKMLYDNALLLNVYAQAASATGEALFSDAALTTAQWMQSDMQAVQGGFYSSIDADSEGHEGKFYVWDKPDLAAHLDERERQVFELRFGFDQPPNFEGQWHLHIHRSIESVAESTGFEVKAVTALLASARAKLLEVRKQRVTPARDEKVLTSWNALAIAAMATTGRLLAQPECTRGALLALDFIRTHLIRDGRLLAVFKDGRANFPAYLDDYAFLLKAALEVLQLQWRSADLQFAIQLADALLAHFENAVEGGFFFTADDHETLIHRAQSFADESLPAGSAIAAQALTRLGLLLGETRYLDSAARTLRAAWHALEQHPQAHATMLMALDEHLDPPQIVIIRGAADEIAQWQASLQRLYAPKRLVFGIPDDAPGLPSAIATKKALDQTVAYVCRGTTCSAPVRSLAALIALAGGEA
jgi:uncharacterized protein YyaL (SSP411 family)